MAFGLLNVFKPAGPTSHDIVAATRRGTGERKVGHAGTLDPLADGVLVLALGQATRLVEYLLQSDKEYLAEIVLGVTTDTFDVQGRPLSSKEVPHDLPQSAVASVLTRFTGVIEQVPPPYSAVKIRGRSAYERARAGEAVHLEPRRVVISALSLVAFNSPVVRLNVACSSGTYIRSLAHDLGHALGYGAVLSQLRRMATGRFRIEDAVSWATLQKAFVDSTWQRYLVPADFAVSNFPMVTLGGKELDDVLHGRSIAHPGSVTGLVRAYSPQGEFVGILFSDPLKGLMRPHKILIHSQTSDGIEEAK